MILVDSKYWVLGVGKFHLEFDNLLLFWLLLVFMKTTFLLSSGIFGFHSLDENFSPISQSFGSLCLGHSERFSVTFSCFFSCFRAQRTLLCYLFLLLLLLLGSENASLLPFSASSLAFGLRERFSITFFCFFSCFRAQRTLLCYLFLLLLLLSGSENASLLPFSAPSLAFGLRERFSVTFSCFFSCFWAQRTLLCYLFLLFLLLLGSENGSLLPFSASSLAFGLREHFSVTFFCSFGFHLLNEHHFSLLSQIFSFHPLMNTYFLL
ncbi:MULTISPECIES: hypothetical protein [Bacillaceae]|uniref:Uncharacterized protein n=3 Tax=Bacillaceae TaxID=186817 RepID=A0ABV1F279_9BACI|nr:hypothetical protein [Bacillus sp. T2.9-1]CAI9390479.1 hypothetical protein BACSP_02837 [Bacillus sp. T2.9-1]